MHRNEIRLMEAAVALAEELNFGRAAERLRIGQPALTKQIAELESRFVITLFERDSQAVSMTEAGRAYVEEARLSLLHSERAVQVARTVLSKAESVVRVGKSAFADPFLVSTLQSIRLSQFPRLKLEVIGGNSLDLVHDLLANRLELALVTDPPESAMLSSLKVSEEQMFVALSEENTLADNIELQLTQLDKRPWAVLNRAMQPIAFDTIMNLASGRGARPSDVHQVLTPEDAPPYLFDGCSVALLPRTAAIRIARDGVTIRPLVEPELVCRTYLASRNADSTQLTSQVVRTFGRKLKAIESERQLNLHL